MIAIYVINVHTMAMNLVYSYSVWEAVRKCKTRIYCNKEPKDDR